MLVPVLILAALLVLNAIFAMAELALMTSRQSRLEASARGGSKGAAAALALARQPTRFLSTVQVGITLIGIFAGAFGERTLGAAIEPTLAPALQPIPWLADRAETVTLVLVVLVITYFTLVFGELVPKRIALAHPEGVSTLIAPPLLALALAAGWPVRLLSLSTDLVARALGIRHRDASDVTADDVRAILARATTAGAFTSVELDMVERVLRFRRRTVRDLMTPRKELPYLRANIPLHHAIAFAATQPFSHLPVCRDDPTHLSGVVRVQDLLRRAAAPRSDQPLDRLMHKPKYVPETMLAAQLLDDLQSSGVGAAFVVDEYGVVLGMLTIEDLTSAIVGDPRPRPMSITIAPSAEGSWLVDGRTPLHELILTLGIPEEAEQRLPDVSTVAGLVTTVLGRIPHDGDTVTWEGYRIDVLDMDATRVDKVLFTRAPELPLTQ